jgi:hypothetical protein
LTDSFICFLNIFLVDVQARGEADSFLFVLRYGN